MNLAVFCVGTYLLGSIPTSLIISSMKGVNLRAQGSGNLGATNVFRVMGWKYALPVFLCDLFKGYLPVMLSIKAFEDPKIHILVAFIAVMGHSLSVFVKFKGGKGAATGLGVLLALNPVVFLICIVTAFSLIGLFRYVAPVTILCCFLAPVLLHVFKSPQEYVFFVSSICLLIIIRHHSNIKRLLKGQENKI